jgi:DNA polymerase-3 subunit delta
MMITPDALRKQIHAGTIAPLYCFYGPNSALITEAVTTLHTVLFPAAAEFDDTSFDAEVHVPSIILNAAQTLPLQSSKRLVVVRRAEAYKAAQWETFQRYFAKPSSQCCLVFIASTEKLPFSDKISALFQKSGTIVFCVNPKKEALGQIIEAELKKYGKKIDREAVNFLKEAISIEGQMLRQEIAKLALYCADKQLIALEDVIAVICGAEQYTIFQLVEAIASGDTARAIKFLNDLMERGLEPLPILGMITRQFRLLAIAGEALRQGKKTAQIMADINEFSKKVSRGKGIYQDRLIERLAQQARNWPFKRLGRAFEEISETDAQLKSSRINKKHILEHLIFQLDRC